MRYVVQPDDLELLALRMEGLEWWVARTQRQWPEIVRGARKVRKLHQGLRLLSQVCLSSDVFRSILSNLCELFASEIRDFLSIFCSYIFVLGHMSIIAIYK
jgi:hypothetical protein